MNLLNTSNMKNVIMVGKDILRNTITRISFVIGLLVTFGVGNVWSDEITLTSESITGTPTTGVWNAYSNTGQTIECDNVTWTFDGTMHTQSGGTPYAYLQLGQKSGLAHTPTVSGNITKIEIDAYGASSGRYLQIEEPDGTHVGDAQLITNSRDTYTFNISGEYTQLNIANHDANGGYSTSNNAIQIYSITVTYGSSVTYTDYISDCCDELAQINGSVSVTNQRSLTLQWDKLSGVDGTTPYTITCKQGSDDAGTIGDVDLSGAKATCTVTGLACSTTYTFTITAHGDATHCDKTQENIQGTTSAAMTLPTLTYATGLTAGGANITPSWASAVSHDGSVSYVSSNPSVVQIVNASTGEAKPVGAGTATITATYAQSTNNCEAAKTSNTISVTGNVTVTFNANGGGGTMQNQSIQVSTPTNLTANAFTTPSSCKYFYGWATSQANADAGTRAYTDGQSVTITEGLNLYAIWKSYNYEVTKGTGTGAATFSLSANNVDCGGSITVTATPDATHKGNPIVSISP